MKREDLTEKLLDIKREKGWSWKHICEKIGGYSEVLIVGAILGQMKLTKPQAANAGELFGLSKSETAMLNEVPMRGTGTPMPPTDPLIYRFYEMVMVNGPAWKALIEEEFGDGIMSAIDFDMAMERVANPEGRPGQDHDVRQIPAVQILRRQRQCAGVWVQGGVTHRSAVIPGRSDAESRFRIWKRIASRFARNDGEETGQLNAALHFLHRRHLAHIGERALVLHFAGAFQEGGERQARHRAADADALDAGFGELSTVSVGSAKPITRLNGFSERRHHGLDGGEVVQAGRIQHVGARGLERLQPLDGVVEVLAAVQEIFGARRQRERERQCARRLDRRLHPLDREREIVDRVARIAGHILDRAADAPASAASPIAFAAASARPRRNSPDRH